MAILLWVTEGDEGRVTTWRHSTLPIVRVNLRTYKPMGSRAGISRNRCFSDPPRGGTGCFLQIEKNMFVTPVFYLGAIKTGRLRHSSRAVAGLLTSSQEGYRGKLILLTPWRMGLCLKHVFSSRSFQTVLQTLLLSGLKCLCQPWWLMGSEWLTWRVTDDRSMTKDQPISSRK